MPSLTWMSISSNWVSWRSFLSSAASGSSRSSTFGRLASARAKRDPLPLAAGELVRPAVGKALELHQPQHLVDARLALGGSACLPAGNRSRCSSNAHMREERVGLEHHVDRPPVGRHAGEVGPAENDPPGARCLEAGEEPHQGGLAAAGRPEQAEELALEDVERQVVDRRGRTEALRHALEADQGHGARLGPRREGAPCRSDGRAARQMVVRAGGRGQGEHDAGLEANQAGATPPSGGFVPKRFTRSPPASPRRCAARRRPGASAPGRRGCARSAPPATSS